MASSESHQADELTIPKESLPLLERAMPRVQRTHGVRVSLLPTTPELSQQWVRLEGLAAGRNRAKDYIKALCSPDVGMDVSYSQPLHCIWAGAGGAWHRAVESLSGAAVTVTEVGTLHISGTDLQVMMAISTLENLQSVNRGSEKAAATRESLDQDRRFRRLLQTIGDGSACDEQLQDLPSAVKQLLMEWIEEGTEDISLSRDPDLDEDESSDDSLEVIEDVVPMKSSSKDQPETDAADKDDAAHTGIAFFTSGTRESDTRDDETGDIPSETGLFPPGLKLQAVPVITGLHPATTRKYRQCQVPEELCCSPTDFRRPGTEVDINTLLDYVEKLQTSEPDQNEDDDDSMEIADDKQQKRQASSDDDIVEIPVGSSNRPVTKTIPERQTTSRNTPKVNRTENAADVSINKGFRYDKPPNQENIRLLKKFAEDFEIPEHLVDRAIADLGSEVDVNTMLDHIATINSRQDVVICRDLGYTDEEIAMAVSRVGEEASLPALLQEVRNINRENQKKERAKPEESNYKAGETVVLPPTRKIFPAGNAANNRSADVMLRPQAPQTIPTVGYVPLLGPNPYPNQAVVRPVPVVLLPTPQQAMVRPYHSLAAEVQAAQNRQFHHARNRTPPSASQSSAAGTGNSFKVGSPPKKQNKQFQDQSVVREQAVVPNLVEKVQKMGEYKLDLPDGPGDDSLRPVVIDGSNVAMSHGKRNFSSRGIALCVEYFWKRGHRDITVFVPNFRKGASTESYLLIELEEKGLLSFTPSRRIKGRTVASYDDRYIVRLAAEKAGVIVSNDNYRDLLDESEAWRDVIENRLLLFTFVGDRFMPPDDPFGRNGPSLDDLLRKQSQKPHRGHNVPPQGPKAGYPGVGNEPLLPGAAAAAAPISQAQVQLFQQLMQVFPGQEDKIRRVLQSNPEMADLNAVSAMVLDVDL
ncbi:NEDD4 binding protein 1 [Branchiostoma belcheri]|nr:NEDD4 binding protein 1 [Branchiostoma belcheri]